MELSSFVGRMFALKNELLYVLSKATDAETYLSNMDQIFMIFTLIQLGTKYENICEHILTSFAILTFDDIFARLLRHSSIATQSHALRFPQTLRRCFLNLTLMFIIGVFVVATEVEDNDLIEWVTFENGVISYMAVHYILLMWPSLLNHLHLRFSLRAIHLLR